MQKKDIKPANKSLTPEQCAKVLAVAESEMKGLVLMAMTTGQRVGDIIVLKRGDVDMQRGIILFHQPKTRRVLEVPLDLRLRMWLEQQPQSRIPLEPEMPMFPQLAARGPAKATMYLRKLGQKVGVVVGAASFRQMFARQLTENGAPTRSINQLLGYRSQK